MPKGKPRKKIPRPWLKGQHERTAAINLLASEVNRVMKMRCGRFSATDLYHRMQHLIRKQKAGTTNRYVMLESLRGMEINNRYPLHRLGVERVVELVGLLPVMDASKKILRKT